MIWGMETVLKVTRMYTVGEFSPDIILSSPVTKLQGLMEYLRTRMFDELSISVATYGVDIHPDDTRMWHYPDKDRGVEVAKLTWSPISPEVELYGGPHDGRVFSVPGPYGVAMIGRIIRVAQATTVDLGELEPSVVHVDYQCGGFNDSTRRWLFVERG